MRTLLNCEIDILALAAEQGAQGKLPPPQRIAGNITALTELGLLQATGDVVSITPEGRASLAQNADRIIDWATVDAPIGHTTAE